LEHAEPTVIHNPEQDMTILARWLQRGMEQGSRFWLLLGGVIVVLFALAILSSGIMATKSTTNDAWIDLTQAKTVEDRLKIAEAHANTPVALWAKLQSAQEEYAYGIDDLTSGTRLTTAGPRLAKALKLFQEVAKEAPKDSSQMLGAMFGAARTLEARNELSLAIEQYRELATKFPNTPEAKQSLMLAKALEEPVNIQFYKELYAYKAPTNALPGGPGDPSSFLNGALPPLGSGAKSPGASFPVPPGLDAPPTTTPTIPPPAETPKAEAPKTQAPKAETPKAEAPAPPSAPATPVEPPKTAAPPK
jgi:tetratricopeptide (TPR) repeat protein